MNISWILSDSVIQDPMLDFAQLKEIGSLWGSWRTWRTCGTDNVLCHDLSHARDLINRNFHQQCNFYIHETLFATLDRPTGVKLYGGEFNHEVEHKEELIAMHLAASVNDIVLLLGFDFQELPKHPDRLIEHRNHNYWNLARQAMINNPQTQWVVINHPGKIRLEMQDLSNISQDTLSNILG